MKLLKLTAKVCFAFLEAKNDHLCSVQKVKDNNLRDVVTNLDYKLDDISRKFLEEYFENCNYLSEETYEKGEFYPIGENQWLVVDPLDGSLNHSLNSPNFGYMATLLNNGRILGTTIVLPEHEQYIVMEDQKILTANEIPSTDDTSNGTVYYAYSPNQKESEIQTRNELLELIEKNSSGFYRYGSSCVGLYNFLCGKHKAFIGHKIRLWDALAFLPILSKAEIDFHYYVENNIITLIASRNEVFLCAIKKVMEKYEDLSFKNYKFEDGIVVV